MVIFKTSMLENRVDFCHIVLDVILTVDTICSFFFLFFPLPTNITLQFKQEIFSYLSNVDSNWLDFKKRYLTILNWENCKQGNLKHWQSKIIFSLVCGKKINRQRRTASIKWDIIWYARLGEGLGINTHWFENYIWESILYQRNKKGKKVMLCDAESVIQHHLKRRQRRRKRLRVGNKSLLVFHIK